MSVGTVLKPLLALLLLAAAGLAGAILYNRPPLLETPGLLPRLGNYLSTNAVESSPLSAYPERRPLVYSRPPEAVLEAATAVARARGWEIEVLDREAGHLRAVARTPLLGFRDDVEVRIRPLEGDRCEVRLRSASRVGTADFGANTRRLVVLRREISRRL